MKSKLSNDEIVISLLLIEKFGDLNLDNEFLSDWRKCKTGVNAANVVDYIKFLNGATEAKNDKSLLAGKMSFPKNQLVFQMILTKLWTKKKKCLKLLQLNSKIT